ncbi:hypothetical protein Dsin_005872 [Dipteronia sinensis]|uniref:Uncharacterized protein n=1 Tax=Dipteronia sinensis TaxID=43782 RepID=A0AAE0AY54_9ROSI|nr:hypothetical protein Dsin_005872 [Dipteronia sinensis]
MKKKTANKKSKQLPHPPSTRTHQQVASLFLSSCATIAIKEVTLDHYTMNMQGKAYKGIERITCMLRRNLKDGVLDLDIFTRYNIALSRELWMDKDPNQKPWDVGQLVRLMMSRAGNRDNSVIPFPFLITYFCEKARVEA